MQARITKSSLTDSPRILVLAVKSSPQARALNESGVGKIHNLQPMCKIGPKLLLMTNRKSHMPFRLVPKSATFDDLEWPIPTTEI